MKYLSINKEEFEKMKRISKEIHDNGLIIPEYEQSAIALDIVKNKVNVKKIIKKWNYTLSN